VSFSVLFVCICVLNYCHLVATQLQLNISYNIVSYLDKLCKYQFVNYFLCIDDGTAHRTFSFGVYDGETTSDSESLMGSADPKTYTFELKNEHSRETQTTPYITPKLLQVLTKVMMKQKCFHAYHTTSDCKYQLTQTFEAI
jgi:hypothetical protein